MKVNIDTLTAICKVLIKIYDAKPSLELMVNVHRSIGFDLSEKLNKKLKSEIKKNNNLLDQKKKFKLSIKLYEAWALKEILRDLFFTVDNDYEKNLIQNAISQLDKELA